MNRKAYTRPVTHYFDLVAEHLMDDSQIVHVSVPIDSSHELTPMISEQRIILSGLTMNGLVIPHGMINKIARKQMPINGICFFHDLEIR